MHNGVSNMAFNDVNAAHANRKFGQNNFSIAMWPTPRKNDVRGVVYETRANVSH